MDILNMAKMIAILTSFIFLNTCLCKHSTYFLDRGSFPSYSKTWISNTLGVGGTKMGNPHEHTNLTLRLLHLEFKFNLTLFPFKFVLEEGINQSLGKIFLEETNH
jgi:hypothetical protein